MRQADLFASNACVALQVWRLAPACSHSVPSLWGRPFAVGWSGPHHCFWCFVDVMRACRQFDANVAIGIYDAQGYTPAERRAQAKRQAA